ncbi:hypothetical protein [Azospirillum soli]|nr:hypothetical protein [Azospirillum soli]MBP2314117.1 hypothetical protein [Azospirillum soli]
METKSFWTPDAERLARETEDLLRFGARFLMGLSFVALGVLTAFALYL